MTKNIYFSRSKMFAGINGLLIPGGAVSIYSSPYATAATYLVDLARLSNEVLENNCLCKKMVMVMVMGIMSELFLPLDFVVAVVAKYVLVVYWAVSSPMAGMVVCHNVLVVVCSLVLSVDELSEVL